jgi:hypothetical protein
MDKPEAIADCYVEFNPSDPGFPWVLKDSDGSRIAIFSSREEAVAEAEERVAPLRKKAVELAALKREVSNLIARLTDVDHLPRLRGVRDDLEGLLSEDPTEMKQGG